MNSSHITLNGVRRKIETKIANERLTEIKDGLTAVKSKDFLEVQRMFYKGGFHDSKGRNIRKQVNRVSELHQKRLEEEK